MSEIARQARAAAFAKRRNLYVWEFSVPMGLSDSLYYRFSGPELESSEAVPGDYFPGARRSA